MTTTATATTASDAAAAHSTRAAPAGSTVTAESSPALTRRRAAGEAVVCLAHGSRHPDAPGVIEELAAATGTKLGIPARAAALDLNEPRLDDAVAELAAAGVRTIYVVPLLWSTAYHHTVDVPAAIAEARARVGDQITIVQTDHLGLGDDIAEVVVRKARTHGGTGDIALYVVDATTQHHQFARTVTELSGAATHLVAATRAGSVDEQLEKLPPHTTIVPLFVAPGLLLQRCRMPTTGPLGADLHHAIATRVRTARAHST